jgi:hypothetical protein
MHVCLWAIKLIKAHEKEIILIVGVLFTYFTSYDTKFSIDEDVRWSY